MIVVEQIINSVYSSNTYILWQRRSKDVWLIDAGDTDLIIKWIKSNEYHLKGVFLTHTHYDHIYGLNQLYKEFPDILVYTSPEGKQGLYSDKLNFSRYHNDTFVFNGVSVLQLNDGEKVKLWSESDMELLVMKTPGHDWSCLTYQIKDCLFTGDSYIPGLKVVSTFPKSNREQAITSVERILAIPDIKTIFPGHGKIESCIK